MFYDVQVTTVVATMRTDRNLISLTLWDIKNTGFWESSFCYCLLGISLLFKGSRTIEGLVTKNTGH